MTLNLILTALFVAFVVALVVIEVFCAVTGRPTISERIQWLGRAAPLVPLAATFTAGVLLTHFFAC